MSRYKAYTEYKDSGLQWLGKTPAHWDVMQSRRLFAQRKERARRTDEQLTASQKYGVIYQKLFMELEGQSVVQVQIGSDILKHVEPNDFVISMRSFQGGLEWCQYSGSVSSAYVGIIPVKHIVPEFFRYLFKSESYIQALQSTSNLVRDGQALRFENFSQVHLPRIPENEQVAIAAFLDHETAKIDALIEKQQRLIELLKEKRQAVISHAVTKGLNPNAPMKDSGVEWLGEVPAHWQLIQIKYLVTVFEQGWSPQCDSRPAEEGEFGVLKVGCVNGGVFNPEENKALPPELAPQTQYSIKSGDLLVSRANTRELVGSAAVVNSDFDKLILCDKLYRLRFQPTVNPRLVALYLSIPPVRQQIELGTSGASDSMQNISQSVIKDLAVLLPPETEANQLVAEIESRIGKFNAILEHATKQISYLQERRTALISAAVTGKIDVRDWQAAAA